MRIRSKNKSLIVSLFNSLKMNFQSLSPSTPYKRKFFKAKVQSFTQVKACSPTPNRIVKTLPAVAISFKSKKKDSDSFLISVGKKRKTNKGEQAFYYIQMINSYTGKSFYSNFVHDFFIPEKNTLLEPENIATDEKLLEFTQNSIKNWVSGLVLKVK